jgi:hypothetical protein
MGSTGSAVGLVQSCATTPLHGAGISPLAVATALSAAALVAAIPGLGTALVAAAATSLVATLSAASGLVATTSSLRAARPAAGSGPAARPAAY